MNCPDCGHPLHDEPCHIWRDGRPCACANYWRDGDPLPLTAGRTSRGNGRRLNRILLTIPLTGAGEISDDAFTTALATLLTYHPTALDPIHLASLMPTVLQRMKK